MAFMENGSPQDRAAPKRPPPVVVSEPELDSPNVARGAGPIVPVPTAGPMAYVQGPPMGLARLPPPVAGPLSVLAGQIDRKPLMYTGDTSASLATLRQDVVASYRAICSVLGEPERTDLVSGGLPTAAALGLPVPAPVPTARLPPLPGGPGPSSAALLLPPPPPAAPATSIASPGQNGSAAMLLGPSLGIEAVGSGANAPARLLTGPVSSSAAAGGRLLAGAGALGNGSPFVGGLRSLSAGHAGLPPVGFAPGADRYWPMGRPGGYGASGRAGLAGRASSGGEGPRISMVSGFRRPQDSGSDFLGEESAVIFPPAGRNFGGGVSAAARSAMGGPGLGPGGQMIDAMDDFRFRAGGRKHIKIEDLDDPSRPIPEHRRNDSGQLEMFLQDYARDRSKPPRGDQGASSRFRMPF